MDTKEKDRDKIDTDQMAYCGLCCADCFGHKGKVADLARDLRKELRESKFEKFADYISTTSFGKVYKDYDKCYEVLGAMVRFRCKKGCRSGGGPPFCKMRKCCQKKGIEGCWLCDDFEDCKNLDFLEPVHVDAHKANIRIIRKKDMDEFLDGKRNW